MKIDLHNIWATVEATPDEERWLDGILSYETWGRGGQIQTYRLFDQFKHRFPAGMMAHVMRRAKRDSMSVDYVDCRVAPLGVDPNADLSWLRDYQLEAVEAAAKRTRGILWCPTGSGKTEMAVGLTQALPCRWLFLAHRGTLVQNAAERYQLRTGAQAGRLMQGVREWGDGALLCATFQTLHAGFKKKDPMVMQILNGAQGIIIDESHTLPAWSFYKIAQATQNAYYRIGLSGTPLSRTDHRSMMSVASLGRVIYRIETDRLIEAGVLSRPTIEMWPCEQTSDQKTWGAVYRNLVVRSKERNAKVVEMAKVAPKPALVFVQHLSHGSSLKSEIQKAGMACDFVDGKSSLAVRQNAVRRLENGDLDVLVATNIFNEGVDIPDLRSVVIAAGGSSSIQALQRIGRGMRRADGKDGFHVYDFKDKGQRWMEKHANARARAYKSEGHEVKLIK